MTTALIEAAPADFAALIARQVPCSAHSLAEKELAPPPVLEMLAALSARIAPHHLPNAWMIVEQGCVAGLITLVAEPRDRCVMIGYGVAESHRGRGVASRAVAALVAVMRMDHRVDAVLAETGIGNSASQHALRSNGFVETGRRSDPEDGDLICWRISVN